MNNIKAAAAPNTVTKSICPKPACSTQIEQPGQPLAEYTSYRLKDHLGSIDVTLGSNLVPSSDHHCQSEQSHCLEAQSYGAFGETRDPNTGSSESFSSQLSTQGYTGHEMLGQVGLIHMNGRLYDPEIGRFLSPDPFVQAPDDVQNFNRYSYVRNNPLKLTDPSGFVFAEEATLSEERTSLRNDMGHRVRNWGHYLPDSLGYQADIRNVIRQTGWSNLLPKELRTKIDDWVSGVDYNALQRGELYGLMDELMKIANIPAHMRTKWFESAKKINGRNAIGAIDTLLGKITHWSDAIDFLEKAGDYLLEKNISNFVDISTGNLPDGVSDVKTALDLSHKLVEFEQNELEEFIKGYFPDEKSKQSVVESLSDDINPGLFDNANHAFSPDIVRRSYEREFAKKNRSFDFSNKDHRIDLGKGMQDFLE